MSEWHRFGALVHLSLKIKEDSGKSKAKKSREKTFTLIGQCVSALRSCILVPELSVAFDFGFAFEQALNHASVVCVSHGHADHVGALHFHAFERHMHNLTPPICVLPRACVDAFETALHGYKCLNYNVSTSSSTESSSSSSSWFQKAAPVRVVAATEGGDAIALTNGGTNYVVRALKTVHGVPSVAYCVSRVAQKLLPQYQTLSGAEIAHLRREKGIQVTGEQETLHLAYTGDTTIDGVVCHPMLLNVPILIMECTYLFDIDDQGQTSDATIDNDTPDNARQRGHIHERHIVDHTDKFQNQHLVRSHLGTMFN